MERFIGLIGIVVFMAIAIGLSRHRGSIHWKTVAWGLGLQWLFAVVVLKGDLLSKWLSLNGWMSWPGFTLHRGTPQAHFYGLGWIILALMFAPMLLRRFSNFHSKQLNWGIFAVVVYGLLWGNLVGKTFNNIRIAVQHLMEYAHDGASFVFGPLADSASGGMGAPILDSAHQTVGRMGMVFAFVVLPTIIFVASIFAVLYYLGVMQWVVGACARAMGRVLKVSGAESVCVAASILMGQTEAPLTIRPFLSRLTRSELMVIMTAGMAHVSGSIMVAYVQIAGVDIVHLLTAVIMTAPGAIMIAKILEPEVDSPETQMVAGEELKVDIPNHDANVIDAAARGAFEGGSLAFNVAVMLIAFIALVALMNGLIKAAYPGGSLEIILGTVFKPFAFLMGVPWKEAGTVGSLLGTRMVVNEFVAFIQLGALPELSTKAKLVSTFALCGFANFSSIAIQVGGIGALIPERRSDLARLGLKAMLAGTLANFLSACIAGVLS
ncbi:MAG: NupC/NupG family nucleoside CNT transporter [Acidobacteriota bacterium]|nr:NupC/NupG family nucleoside CNT transporter [Acidobacteriota bacterium]